MTVYRLVSGLEEALDSPGNEILAQWNEGIEKLLTASPESQVQPPSSDDTDTDFADESTRSEAVLGLSKRLVGRLLRGLQETSLDSMNEDSISSDETARQVLRCWDYSVAAHVPESLRACKNWMRWYLQIYEAQHYPQKCLIEEFRSTPVLEIYLTMAEVFSDEQLAQAASQLLFYATFRPIAGSDEQLLLAFEYLLDSNLLERLLKRLLGTQTVALALSLVKNIHNLIASVDKGARSVRSTVCRISADDEKKTAPWLMNRKDAPVTFQETLTAMIPWCLTVNDSSFPGQEDDKRAELVTEILRCFFALRVGIELKHPLPPGAADLAHAVFMLLRLDLTNSRSYDCALATLPLLMDADASFGSFLLCHDVAGALLFLLEKQVDSVISSQRIDNVAVATTTPVLVCLYKFCSGNDEFRLNVKSAVFPLQREAYFQSLVAEEQKETEGGTARNMPPLDAPPLDSLRGKLIRLLTWANSTVKRFAGELLWVLCDINSDEFIHRVGLGNGLPLLNAKGIVTLPPNISGQS